MSFTEKFLDVTFTLASGATVPVFQTTGTNTSKHRGLRTIAKIVNSGGFAMESLELHIFGLNQSVMNQLSTLGLYPLNGANSVTVKAREGSGQPNLVFQGTINAAFADMNAQPEVSFTVQANSTQYQAVTPEETLSRHGAVDVVTELKALAAKMNLAFENNGVTTQLYKGVYTGSALDQARSLVEHSGIQATIERGTLAIWPTGGARNGDAVTISVKNGMIGYPSYAAAGLVLKTLYNSNIRNGGLLNVESSLQPACGRWVGIKIDHDLSALLPNGPWETTILATKFGLPGQAP